MWQLHQQKLMFSGLLLLSSLLLALQLGDVKPLAAVDLIDALGEGCTLLVCCSWLWLIVSSRPAGRVTERLYYGCLLLVFCYFLDVGDEFIHYPADSVLMIWLESFTAPVGMVLLTFGLVGWHHEQRAIDRQLRGRELFFRDHQLLDPLTQLYGADYLQAVLDHELALQQDRQRTKQPLSLLVIDICRFSDVNRQFGVAAADDLLCQLGEAVASQLRFSDLVCRFRADCFIAVLPNTALAQALQMQHHLQQQLQKLNLQPAATLTIVAQQVDANDGASALAEAAALLSRKRSSRLPGELAGQPG